MGRRSRPRLQHKAMAISAWRSVRELEAEVERLAERSRGCGRRGRQSLRPRQERRGAAEMGRLQKERVAEDPAAKAELEAEAKRLRRPRPSAGRGAATSRGRRNRAGPLLRSEEPDTEAQKNFTDPKAASWKRRTASSRDNAQAAVDATAQVIVADGLDAKQSDQHQSVADRRRHRSQSGQELMNCRRTRAIRRRQPGQRWRNARSTPISRRVGEHAG